MTITGNLKYLALTGIVTRDVYLEKNGDIVQKHKAEFYLEDLENLIESKLKEEYQRGCKDERERIEKIINDRGLEDYFDWDILDKLHSQTNK